jgi:DNA-binding transcriptional LysR family regulator
MPRNRTGRELLVGLAGKTLNEDEEIALLAYPQNRGGLEARDGGDDQQVPLRNRVHERLQQRHPEMVLTGLGIAWLPGALIADDLSSGGLTVLGGNRMQCSITVTIYGPVSDQDPFDKLLRQLLRSVDLTTIMEQGPWTAAAL